MQYANRWGWTPAQVDELPAKLEPWLLPIAAAVDEAVTAKQNAQRKGSRLPWRR